MKRRTNLSFDNAVIIRKKRDGMILKGIHDDEIREDRGTGIEIFILAKNDGERIRQLRKNLERYGIKVEFEVLPCG